MDNMKKWLGVFLCAAMLASVSACGKQGEEAPTTPEDITTEMTTAVDADTEATTEETIVSTEAATKKAVSTTAVTTEDAAATTAEGDTTAASDETTAASETATTAAAAADTTTAAAAATDAPTQATPAPTEAATPAPTEAPTPAPQPAGDDPLVFSYGGSSVKLGESAQAFTAAVPANSEEKSPSCLGNGEDINYYYNDFTLYVWNDNGSYKTIGIDIISAGAGTNRGITIGSTAEQVIAAYGNDYTERGSEFVYDFGNNCSLCFALNDGAVVAIGYNQDN